VIVTRKAKYNENKWYNCWVDEMDCVIGKKVKIEDVGYNGEYNNGGCVEYLININGRLYNLPEFILEKANYNSIVEVSGYMYNNKFYLTKEEIEEDKLIDDFYNIDTDNWNELVKRQLTLWGRNNKAIEDFVNWG
jgi:hypothetical protein